MPYVSIYLQVNCLLLLGLLLFLLSQLLGVSSLVDENYDAQDGHFHTDAQERPESSVLICTVSDI